jgi:hypothetical protein
MFRNKKFRDQVLQVLIVAGIRCHSPGIKCSGIKCYRDVLLQGSKVQGLNVQGLNVQGSKVQGSKVQGSSIGAPNNQSSGGFPVYYLVIPSGITVPLLDSSSMRW